jgi:hypothetical protein
LDSWRDIHSGVFTLGVDVEAAKLIYKYWIFISTSEKKFLYALRNVEV